MLGLFRGSGYYRDLCGSDGDVRWFSRREENPTPARTAFYAIPHLDTIARLLIRRPG